MSNISSQMTNNAWLLSNKLYNALRDPTNGRFTNKIIAKFATVLNHSGDWTATSQACISGEAEENLEKGAT